MASPLIVEALAAVGDRLDQELHGESVRRRLGETVVGPRLEPPTVHLLLAGGAAGMLTGLLDAERTTTDCDVMLYEPAEARELVDRIAAEVAGDFGLSERWLNSGGAPWMDAMPAGWRERLETVLVRGPLHVHAVGRLDLLALKLMAGRPQDIEDLETMSMTAEEVTVLRAHFTGWTDASWPAGAVANAVELLEALASEWGSAPSPTPRFADFHAPAERAEGDA
ncbi:MAG: DUF6036 family nucleotidyltransferase [Phycisphaerales bacterium]